MKKAFLVALAVACGAAFATGEYVARGIERKIVYLDGGTNVFDGVVDLAAGRTVAPYQVQVLSATRGSASAVTVGVTTNYTVIDRTDYNTYGYVYTNYVGGSLVTLTNRFTRNDATLVGAYRPAGFTLLAQFTNATVRVTTNTVDAVTGSHYSVTTNTVPNVVTNFTPSAAGGTITLFGVERVNNLFTTNTYLSSGTISSGKMALTNCYQASTPLFAGDQLRVRASAADKILLKVIYLTFGKE